jgi:hypothetical protein
MTKYDLLAQLILQAVLMCSLLIHTDKYLTIKGGKPCLN